MKNALILHGTGSNSQDNWFPWLEKELAANGFAVWTPDLPGSDKPNCKRYTDFIFNNKDFVFSDETILVGHSSGAVVLLSLLQALPEKVQVKACYLVGSFKNDLGWDALTELFIEPLDFAEIKKHSRLFYFLHSDDDPHCPLRHAEYLHEKIGGSLIVLPGQKHFSVSTAGEMYRQFPYLLHLITGDRMTQAAVLALYSAFENLGVTIWIDGGWGVDALLEEQTRPHGDLDIVVQKKDVAALVKFLEEEGYNYLQTADQTAWNFVLGNKAAQFIDFHVIQLDTVGNGSYGPAKNNAIYPAAALAGWGKIGNQKVRCISPEWMVKFHTGYALRQSDYHDVKALCHKFGLELPKEYAN